MPSALISSFSVPPAVAVAVAEEQDEGWLIGEWRLRLRERERGLILKMRENRGAWKKNGEKYFPICLWGILGKNVEKY